MMDLASTRRGSGESCATTGVAFSHSVLQERLRQAYERGGSSPVRSLRTDPHADDAGCLSLRVLEEA